MFEEYPLDSLPKKDRDMIQHAMDASVLSGVVHSWSNCISKIWEYAERHGHGTEWVNQHPINLVLVDKLRQLARHTDKKEDAAYKWLFEKEAV